MLKYCVRAKRAATEVHRIYAWPLTDHFVVEFEQSVRLSVCVFEK